MYIQYIILTSTLKNAVVKFYNYILDDDYDYDYYDGDDDDNNNNMCI